MNVVVTGGGTLAPIDDVRAITNASSGRFSARITEACLALGATVWHIHAPGAVLPFARSASFDLDAEDEQAEFARLSRLRRQYRVHRDRLKLTPLHQGTVDEYAAILRLTMMARPIDIVFLAMAVSDFAPARVEGKLPSGTEELVLRCTPTPKVIRSVRDWAPEVYLVGFKLLSGVSEEELIATARAACLENRADLTIANDLKTVRDGRHRALLVRPEPAVVETYEPVEEMAGAIVERVFTWARDAQADRDAIPIDGSLESDD